MKVLKAAYDYYAEHHDNDRKGLVRHLNFFNLYPGGTGVPVSKSYVRETFMQRIEASINTSLVPKMTLASSIPTDNHTFFYSLEWHGPFQRFVRLGENYAIAPPGYDIQHSHQNILANLYEIVNTVRTPEFRARVDAEAEKLGYKFDPHFDPRTCAGIFAQ